MTAIKHRFLGSIQSQDEESEPIEGETEHAMAPNSNPIRQRRTGFIRKPSDKDKGVKLGVPAHRDFDTFSADGDSELRVDIPPEDSFLDFKTDEAPAETEFISKDAADSIIEVDEEEVEPESGKPAKPAVVGVPPPEDSFLDFKIDEPPAETEFISKDAADSIIDVDVEEEEKLKAKKPAKPVKVGVPPPKDSFLDAAEVDKKKQGSSDEVTQFQTPGVALLASSPSSISEGSGSTESSMHRMDTISFVYFGVGAMVGIGLAAMFIFRIGRRRRRFFNERKRRKTFNHYDDTIRFRDECDSVDDWASTDESTVYDPEGIHYMEKQPLSFDSDESDWLGGIGYEHEDDEGSYNNENINELDNMSGGSSCYSSDYSSEYESDGNNSLQDLLNNESSNEDQGEFSLDFNDLPSMSPQVKRPTVPQLFHDTLSSHWNQAKLGLLPLTNENEDSNNSTFCELQQEQEELNKSIFMLNDKILEKHRELDAAAKTLTQKITRRKHKETFVKHKKISEEINRLEEEKEDVDAKLKTARTKIKGHRLERRRRLFLDGA